MASAASAPGTGLALWPPLTRPARTDLASAAGLEPAFSGLGKLGGGGSLKKKIYIHNRAIRNVEHLLGSFFYSIMFEMTQKAVNRLLKFLLIYISIRLGTCLHRSHHTCVSLYMQMRQLSLFVVTNDITCYICFERIAIYTV